jgi:hypothetical protein
MWFFQSVELLPRPTLQRLIPSLAMIVVWFLFHGLQPEIFGHPVQAIWLAVGVQAVLGLANRVPGVLGVQGVNVKFVLGLFVAFAGFVLAGVFLHDAKVIQVGWLAGWLIYTAMFAAVPALFSDDSISQLPFRWASTHPFARQALWITAVRFALVALGASWVMSAGSLTDWVLFLTLGQLALFYLFEWVTILMALSLPDDEI